MTKEATDPIRGRVTLSSLTLRRGQSLLTRDGQGALVDETGAALEVLNGLEGTVQPDVARLLSNLYDDALTTGEVVQKAKG